MTTDKTALIGSGINSESNTSKRKIWMIIFGAIIVIVVISLIIYFATESDDSSGYSRQSNEYYEEKFLEIPSNESCYNYSHILANKPHVAGEKQTLVLASIISQIFDELGYEVIRDNISNMVFDHYIDSSLSLTLSNQTTINVDLSNELIPNDQDTNTSYRYRAWQAYGASGDVSAPLLYVNTASLSDLEYLQNDLGFNLSQYIALVKAGSRASRAERVGLYGMKGMIQFVTNYNDPAETYPNGPLLPNSGFMYGRIRGSTGCPGGINPMRLEDECGFNTSHYDDLFPSLKYNVPSIIISANNAIKIFNLFNNQNNVSSNSAYCNDSNNVILPSNWFPGNLPVDAVCVGSNINANLMTQNDVHFNDTIQNVYGYLEGDTYPDEIVMIGAHRDAWALGACDDISGTVTMLEIARSLSILRSEYDWRPRRSLMFGSWDGEEWGLYGSVDFNENNRNRADFIDKIVTYINFDMTVTGQNMVFLSNPLFRSLLFESSADVNYPYNLSQAYGFNDSMSLYDVWSKLNPSGNLRLVTTGSDYGAFEYYSGVPTLGVRFDTYPASFPDVYHTFYDLNGWMDKIDPNWLYAQKIATLGGLLMLKISQQQILPWDIDRFSDKMLEWIDTDLYNKAVNDDCQFLLNTTNNIDLFQLLRDSVNDFVLGVDIFNSALDTYMEENDDDDNDMNEDDVSKFNEILMHLTREMTLKYPNGLPSNRWYKNLIIDPGSKRYPYIWDTISNGCNEDELIYAVNLTAQHVYNASLLLQSIVDQL